MKIAVFDNVPPGGAARVVYEQVLYLTSLGHQIVWFSAAHQKKALLPNSVVIINHQINNKTPDHETIISRAFWLRYQLRGIYQTLSAQISAHNPDLLLVHPCRHTQAPYLLRLSKIPTLYFIEEPLRVVSEPELHSLNHLKLLSRWSAMYERSMLKRIDTRNTWAATVRLTHSQFNARSILKHYGLQAQPIGLGVDSKIFKKSAKTNWHEPFFLFVGGKDEINGHTFLHKAILHKKINVRYVSSQNGTLPFSDKQLAHLYSQAVATLCLARKEPFGLVALESMSCATPVIALSEGGYKETVISEKTGLLIKRHPKSLATAIDRMLDPQFHKTLAKQCRAHAVKNFSWQSHGEKLHNILIQAQGNYPKLIN